ncbi:chorismate mutase [Methylacidimicrobium sp. B4]|uniref:chorismate mutase n=1 Tax=Methylacidimicrobium sp. B4 TaxID=2796139 RepID=UPI001A8D60E5|nr:chorismate mutase [Methylacidimicrobium sp. B4]QSR85537.1 chorismate mutase [Methylacidimicrobium sp. B4]
MTEPPGSEREIDRLRRRLGEIDRELLALLNRRMEVARDVGEWKRRNGFFLFDPIREEAVIADLIRRNAGSLSDRGIRAIFLEIFSSARGQQGLLRIGCGGGAAGLLAAHSRFGASDHFLMVRSAAEGQRRLTTQSIDILVLPKEGVLDLSPTLRQTPGAVPQWTIRGEIDRPYALVGDRASRFGFYILGLGEEPPGPRELPETQKAVFLLVGGSRESIDRWTGRLGGCWIERDRRPRVQQPTGTANLAGLWEAFAPSPPEVLQERCREICGNSAWIVRLGAYPISTVAHL